MSVQFGKCNFDGKSVNPVEFERVRPLLVPYGPDDEGVLCKQNVGVFYRAFHTTKESRAEIQPWVTSSGSVITWDGRLDNRESLLRQLGDNNSSDSTDVAIAAACYERWKTDAFSKLIGDWALSIWDSKDHSLFLATDFLGTRHLYYTVEGESASWCTILDPLVLLTDRSFTLELEYVAGWLSFFPATHLTAYVGIRAVPPSCFVRVNQQGQKVSRYWEFNPAYKVRYRTDAEYEEHFRTLFAQSVRRRLRSHRPVLAELSGGIDSASIVCVADNIVGQGLAETPRLDTVSYYDDSEPNWDERPYFTRVEERRGRTGLHIEVSSDTLARFESDYRFAATPCSGKSTSKAREEFASVLTSQGNRVVLSGIGGDEVAGGVPTPIPELEDLIATARFGALAQRLTVWALQTRRPWLHLLLEALRGFLPISLAGIPRDLRPAYWLDRGFVRENRAALSGYHARLRLLGPLPSFQENISALHALQRQLACEVLQADPGYEKRYPYLDRDLLEFMYAVPREQMVRPGHRRSLQRRALAGIVPDEILNRRRKAYVTRAPRETLSQEWTRRVHSTEEMATHDWKVIDADKFVDALHETNNNELPIVFLFRTLAVEAWLRHLRTRRIFTMAAKSAYFSSGSGGRS